MAATETISMNPEPRLPRALSLTEIQHASAGMGVPPAPDRLPGAGKPGKVILTLRNIAHPLPFPKGAELISLTTYEGRLVVLTSKGPYIRRESTWEKILASQPDPDAE
jgi:hypothetical protein